VRQRKVRNKEEIFVRCAPWIISDPTSCKGNWASVFPGSGRLFLEIGSGKGKFITSLAAAHPQYNFIAVEGGANIAVRILEKAEAAGSNNLLVITEYAEDLTRWFAPGETDGIYVNFCDPWPKLRHAERRLTHRLRLAQYQSITKPGSELALKTDNQALFTFSLQEFQAAGLVLLEHTRDLYGDGHRPQQYTTEYEDKFSKEGKPICFARAALHDRQ